MEVEQAVSRYNAAAEELRAAQAHAYAMRQAAANAPRERVAEKPMAVLGTGMLTQFRTRSTFDMDQLHAAESAVKTAQERVDQVAREVHNLLAEEYRVDDNTIVRRIAAGFKLMRELYVERQQLLTSFRRECPCPESHHRRFKLGPALPALTQEQRNFKA